jgi:hypothetical protein
MLARMYERRRKGNGAIGYVIEQEASPLPSGDGTVEEAGQQ